MQISKDDFLKSNMKGIYFCFTCNDSKKYLEGLIDICPNTFDKKYSLLTSKEIFNWWLEKWCIKRFETKKNNNTLR